MLLDPADFSLAQRVDELLPQLPVGLRVKLSRETHQGAVELATAPHDAVPGAVAEVAALRSDLAAQLARLGVRVAGAGTHPFAMWTETEVSAGPRYEHVHSSMRELARREPTFAMHVHVGVPEPEQAIELLNALRFHLPLLLAASANSPYWQGRDSGLASARTAVFKAFPRIGIPRRFRSYREWVETVDQLLRCGAFPDPTFLWWDARLQPKFGTVEVRIMDAQSTAEETEMLASLLQSVAHLELEESYHARTRAESPELLDENRFLAARDGMQAALIDPLAERRVAATQLLRGLLSAARPHAQDLGCETALAQLAEREDWGGAARQRAIVQADGSLPQLVHRLADRFSAATPPAPPPPRA
jgi:carboxylate-amine ligase